MLFRSEWDMGREIDNASYKWNCDEEYTGEIFNEKMFVVNDERGFDVVAKYIYSQLDQETVKLGQVVTEICTENNKVQAVTQTG